METGGGGFRIPWADYLLLYSGFGVVSSLSSVLAKKIFVYLKNASRSGLAEVHSIHRVDQAAAISISVDKIINVLGPLFVANMHRSSVLDLPPPPLWNSCFRNLWKCSGIRAVQTLESLTLDSMVAYSEKYTQAYRFVTHCLLHEFHSDFVRHPKIIFS